MISTARKLNPPVTIVGRLGKCICDFGNHIFSRTDPAVVLLNIRCQCGDVGVQIVECNGRTCIFFRGNEQ